jgi:hypothetical protein
VVESGTRELQSDYNVHVLKSPDLILELHNVGVLEEYDWDAGTRRIAFFVDRDVAITLDGKPLEPADGMSYPFENKSVTAIRLIVEFVR